MKGKKSVLYWAPRIVGILAILFVSMFALDAFQPGVPLWRQILNFLIHLIPSFILTALLVFTWRFELVGGILFVAIGLFFSVWVYTHNYGMNQSVLYSLMTVLLITFPFVLIGILFIWNHFRHSESPPKETDLAAGDEGNS